MKCIAIITLFFAQVLTCFAQNFEGKLVYDVHFEINEELLKKRGSTKEDVIKRMKTIGEHFDETTIYLSKNGDYIRETNAKSGNKFLYQSSSNHIFLFEKKSKYVTVINADKYGDNRLFNTVKPKVFKVDSTKIILDHTCKLVTVDWEKMGMEYYWYSDNFQLDTRLFAPHNYEYMNRVFELTNAYPIEITKKMRGSLAMTITLRNYEAIELPDEIFAVPKMKKSKRKKDKRIEKMTKNQVMKIKA